MPTTSLKERLEKSQLFANPVCVYVFVFFFRSLFLFFLLVLFFVLFVRAPLFSDVLLSTFRLFAANAVCAPCLTRPTHPFSLFLPEFRARWLCLSGP